jgi:hypothetical protein
MSNTSKGIKELYQEICNLFDDKYNFYDWIFPPDFENMQVGQICIAPVWYEKKKRWYLKEEFYNPIDEKNSTWKALLYSGKTKEERVPETHVAKYFELEKGENLLASPGKYRPVVLIKKYKNDWINPAVEGSYIDTWLCMPIFTIKPRHSQDYVLNIQKFESFDKIYLPPAYKNLPGILNESVIQLNSIQMIKEEYLEPLKSMCIEKEPKMKRPFKISTFALKILMYHYLYHLNLFDILIESIDTDDKSAYTLFVDAVQDAIQKSLSKL